jgi:Ca-activated chloride channel family protein
MKLLWPDALWLALVVALVAAWRAYARRRSLHRRPDPQGLGRAVARAGRASPVSLLLFGAGLALAAFSLARPHAHVAMPVRSATVVLVIDVSASMSATDVRPRRLDAAKQIAIRLVGELPPDTEVGLVSLAGAPAWVLAPTRNRGFAVAEIERLEIGQGTALGTAIALALAMLFPEEGIEPDALVHGISAAWPGATRNSGLRPGRGPDPDESAALVLISDGQSSAGAQPLEAARLAASLGVRVYAVGIGTPAGQRISSRGWSMRVGIDEPTLREIARITRGAYSRGEGAAESILQGLRAQRVFESGYSEITGLFALAAALLVATSALLSVRRHKRIL